VGSSQKIEWSSEMDAKLRELWPTMKRYEVARILGVTEPTAYRRAKLLGVKLEETRASRGGKVETETTATLNSTRRFEEVYRDAAKRNGWVVREYRV
jgi:hypothetical protein